MNMARFEKERKTAEQELARSRALNAQVLTFSKTETELRSQLNIYVEKFKQVRYPDPNHDPCGFTPILEIYNSLI